MRARGEAVSLTPLIAKCIRQHAPVIARIHGHVACRGPRVAAAATPAAAAQAAVTQTPAPGNASLTPPASNRVGDATSYLLALQASGQYASRNAYPVTSDVAQRSYQRYLESFTHKIPESAETQVGSKTGGSR